MMCSLYCSGGENTIVPSAVAQRTAFDRRKACRECSEQHRGSQPEGKLCRAPSRVVGGSLCFGDHVVDALLRIGLAQTGASRHDLRHISFVGGAKILIVAEACRPQPQNFRPRLIGVHIGRRGRVCIGRIGRGCRLCRGIRAEQFVDVNVSRIDGSSRLRCCTAQPRRGTVRKIRRGRA